ncbi:MAG: hypothetical protein LBV30_05035 [Propionibacteriaceae bacterium]|jgi:hypothetical protein|nr:hypothetical protein [Propionibacteriaceae bacterium]
MTHRHITPEDLATLTEWAKDIEPQFEDMTVSIGVSPSPLLEIRRLRYQRQLLDAKLSQTVQRARSDGDSWHKIAMALGVTAEAARQRYREPLAA